MFQRSGKPFTANTKTIRQLILCLFLLSCFFTGSAQDKSGNFMPDLSVRNDISYTGNMLASSAKPYSSKIISPAFAPIPALAADVVNGNILGMFILAGYGKLRYNVYNETYYTMDHSFTKGGGISYEVPLGVFEGKFSVYNELGFSLFKSQATQHFGDTVGGDPVNNYYDINVTFAPNMVFLTNMLRYSFTPGEFKYYVAIGISSSFVVSSVNTKETLHTTNGSTQRYMDVFIPEPSVFGITVPVSTGFSYRNSGFELRFDPGHSFSNRPNYSVYMPAFYALLHVRFMPRQGQ